jgi:hypothetical protein
VQLWHVSDALDHAVHVAGVAQVLQTGRHGDSYCSLLLISHILDEFHDLYLKNSEGERLEKST